VRAERASPQGVRERKRTQGNFSDTESQSCSGGEQAEQHAKPREWGGKRCLLGKREQSGLRKGVECRGQEKGYTGNIENVGTV